MSEFIYQGKRIYYEETSGQGPLLIFAHGNTASGRMFAPFLEDFAKFHCVLIDFMGHGKSERIDAFPADFWIDQGQQLLALKRLFPDDKAILIGSSGGAIAVLNAALLAPDEVSCVIADSFEGEQVIPALLQNFEQEREASLHDPESIQFYLHMQGADYETIVRQDTMMMLNHLHEQRPYYALPLSQIAVPVLLTGSEKDDMIPHIKDIYLNLCRMNEHYQMHTYKKGKHPACFSNASMWISQVHRFLRTHL